MVTVGVIFDRPAYGRAVLEYVWDNYDVMRKPLLTWLVATAQNADPEDHAVAALAALTLRHGTVDHLITLGELVGSSQPKVLGAVLESAVRNEHVGRLAWEVLYGWAEQKSYAPAVIARCRRILEDSSVATSVAKRAIVRLRRARTRLRACEPRGVHPGRRLRQSDAPRTLRMPINHPRRSGA